MVPTDAVVAAIQDGFAMIVEGLEDIDTSYRQAHGLEEADEELEQLRQKNADLTTANDLAQQQLQQLRTIVGHQVPPQPGDARTVPAPGPAQAPADPAEPSAQAPAPTPPDGQ